jgi:hypothetical protein
MKNKEYLEYTYLHRQAYLYVVEKMFATTDDLHDAMIEAARYHDLDKAVLYTIISKKNASLYHKLTANHHIMGKPYGPKEIPYQYKVEAIVDYECAGYTKADKPLNAYDTIRNSELFTQEWKDELLEICDYYGIARSYRNLSDDREFLEYRLKLPVPSEKNIIMELYDYLSHVPNNVMNVLRTKYNIDKIDGGQMEIIVENEIQKLR